MAIADINVRIGAEIKQLQKGLRASEKALSRSAKKFSSYGSQMTAAVTIPVAGFLGRSVQLFDKQAQSIAQVEAGLKSTNGTVGHTSEALQKMASDLQAVSVIGDEDILKNVTAQLLTFTNVTNEQFPRAQQAIIDLSTRMGTDLKGAALQVGKALNDPVLGITALSRSGIQFTEDQKKVIKTLSETGRMAEAQTIILKELETQFGGSAQAAADAGLGPIKQFNNSLGDMMETIGGAVLPSLTIFVKKIKTLFERFDALSDSTKKNVIQVALFAAAIGPALKIVSFAISGYKAWLGITTALRIATLKFSFSVKGLTAAMAANPIGFMVAALAAVATGLAIAYNRSQKFRAVVAGLGGMLKEFFKIIKEGFGKFAEGFEQLKEGNFRNAMSAFGEGLTKTNPITLAFTEGERLGTAYADGYKDKIAMEAAAMQEAAVKAVSIPITPISTPTSTPQTGGGGGGGNGGMMGKLNQAIPTLTSLQSITAGLVESSTAASASFEGFGGFLEKVTERAEMLKNAFTPMQAILKTAGQQMVQLAAQGEISFKKLGKAALAGAAQVARAKIIEGLVSLAAKIFGTTGFAGLFIAPAAIAGATALFNKTISSVGVPALAKGGAAHGPTMATIGDNVNARSNPEVVTPANTLPGIFRKAFDKDGFGGGGGQKLVAKISGRDMYFFLENEKNHQKRMGII